MKKLLTLLLLVLFLAALPGKTDGRSVKAYFDGQEATVSGIVLRQGEPFTVDLNVTPDGEADVWAEIDEPGTSRAYDRLGGDRLMPTEFKRCNASSGARFSWEMAANGNWLNGTAPLNIYYQINGRNSNEVYASGYFTVVEAYITPGAPAVGTAGADNKNNEKVPGPGVIMALAGILLALLIRKTAS